MNPDLKARWIADLRANPDLQGREQMRTPEDKFCCLGRLCEVHEIKFDSETREYIVQVDDEFGSRRFNGEFPRVVLSALGIAPEVEVKLIAMNDCSRMTFLEIATWIERNL